MVLVSAKDKRAIYLYLLQEGVFCSKKDYSRNNEILNIPNINCFLVMRSLVARKYCTEIFSWQWHYYFLTETGVKFLREYLGLPEAIIPKTHKFDAAPQNEEEEEKEEKRGRGEGRGRGRGRGRCRKPEEEQATPQAE